MTHTTQTNRRANKTTMKNCSVSRNYMCGAVHSRIHRHNRSAIQIQSTQLPMTKIISAAFFSIWLKNRFRLFFHLFFSVSLFPFLCLSLSFLGFPRLFFSSFLVAPLEDDTAGRRHTQNNKKNGSCLKNGANPITFSRIYLSLTFTVSQIDIFA